MTLVKVVVDASCIDRKRWAEPRDLSPASAAPVVASADVNSRLGYSSTDHVRDLPRVYAHVA
jgi:hypothetical protein